jgi:hypothetical protein
VVRLRKAHPCGGADWQVYRLGADIGLRCLTCGRRVMLERAVLERRIKQFVSRGAAGNQAIMQSGNEPSHPSCQIAFLPDCPTRSTAPPRGPASV